MVGTLNEIHQWIDVVEGKYEGVLFDGTPHLWGSLQVSL